MKLHRIMLSYELSKEIMTEVKCGNQNFIVLCESGNVYVKNYDSDFEQIQTL